MIGHYLRPDAVFPPAGLGSGMTQDDKVIYAIKKCVEYYITIAVLDEVAAIDGTCPLELLADCSGIAWGGTAYQMVRDLSHFKVLLTAGRGLTESSAASMAAFDLGSVRATGNETKPEKGLGRVG